MEDKERRERGRKGRRDRKRGTQKDIKSKRKTNIKRGKENNKKGQHMLCYFIFLFRVVRDITLPGYTNLILGV